MSDLGKYLTLQSFTNQLNYVFSYDDKDLDKKSKRDAIKKEIMARSEWKDAVEIYKHINKSKIFKSKYDETFTFLIYCFMISPDIRKISTKGGNPNSLVAIIKSKSYNCTVVIVLMVMFFMFYVIIDDINRLIESQNIFINPTANNEALDKLMASPEYAKYENNVKEYYNITQDEQDETDLVEYKLKTLQRNSFAKKLTIFSIFLPGFAMKDLGDALFDRAKSELHFQLETWNEIMTEYIASKGATILEEIVEKKKAPTMMDQISALRNPTKVWKRGLEDGRKVVQKNIKHVRSDFMHEMESLYTEIESNFDSSITNINRKIEDYNEALSPFFWYFGSIVSLYITSHVYARLGIEGKKRGRPIGSKDKKPRITNKSKSKNNEVKAIEDKKSGGNKRTLKIH